MKENTSLLFAYSERYEKTINNNKIYKITHSALLTDSKKYLQKNLQNTFWTDEDK